MGACCNTDEQSILQKQAVNITIKQSKHVRKTKLNPRKNELDYTVSFDKERLNREFFHRDCITLSKELLGKVLVRILKDGTILSGLIIEVEAYLGGNDKAAHSYKNIKTEKNKSMFLDGGYCYIYRSFRGHNDCFNITSDKEGIPAAVLIRAIYPLNGFDIMKKHRMQIGNKKNPKLQNLCSGPALLCQSFKLKREEFDGVDLINNHNLYIERIISGNIKDIDFKTIKDKIDDSFIIATPRINIEYAGKEWASKLLRFCLKGFDNFLSGPSKRVNSKKYVMIWPDL